MILLEKFQSSLVRAADSRGSGSEHKSGNFADNPEKAAEAGQKGGQHSHGGSSAAHGMGSSEHKSGNFADNPAKAAEAGRKGGHASHAHKG